MTYIRAKEPLSFYAYNSINTLFNQTVATLEFDTPSGVTITGSNDTNIQQPARSIMLADSRCESDWNTDPRMASVLRATSASCINTRTMEQSGTGGARDGSSVASGIAYSLNNTNTVVSNTLQQVSNAVSAGLDFFPYVNYSRIVGWRIL